MKFQQENVFLIFNGTEENILVGAIIKDPKSKEVVICKVTKMSVVEDAVKILNSNE